MVRVKALCVSTAADPDEVCATCEAPVVLCD